MQEVEDSELCTYVCFSGRVYVAIDLKSTSQDDNLAHLLGESWVLLHCLRSRPYIHEPKREVHHHRNAKGQNITNQSITLS